MIEASQVQMWLAIAGFAAAGSFFVWKLFTGWLFINLKVAIKLDRVRKDDANDHLGITLSLDKGSIDSVWLKHVSARVTWDGNREPEPIDMSAETQRLHVHAKKAVWDQLELAGRSIALSPGEATTIARYAEVPAAKPVKVEVLIFGDRTFWRERGFQWRASAVSLPLPDSPASK